MVSSLLIQSEDFSITAIDPLSAEHPEFLCNKYDGECDQDHHDIRPNKLTIEMKTFPEDMRLDTYQLSDNGNEFTGPAPTTHMAVRLEYAKMKFINRRLNEFKEFLLGRVMGQLMKGKSYIDGEFQK